MKFILSLFILIISFKNFGQKSIINDLDSKYISINPSNLDSIISQNNELLVIFFNPLCSSFDIQKDITDVIKKLKKYETLDYLIVSDIFDSASFLKIREALPKTDIFYLDSKIYSNNQRKARIRFTDYLKSKNLNYKAKGKLFSLYLIINKKLVLSTWEAEEIFIHLAN